MASRAVPLVLTLAAFAVVAIIGPKWPRDQSVRVDLGDAASRVREVRFVYADEKSAADAEEWGRAAQFRYPSGAPRIVHHDLRIADGDYVVEIEIATDRARTTQRRNVHLGGGATSIDLAGAVPL